MVRGDRRSARGGVVADAAFEPRQPLVEGEGEGEYAIVEAITSDKAPAVSVGDKIVAVDPRYFRPAEVETLLGDPAKAKEKLGWEPEITVEEMCAEMVAEDLKVAERHALLKAHGYELPVAVEMQG